MLIGYCLLEHQNIANAFNITGSQGLTLEDGGVGRGGGNLH